MSRHRKPVAPRPITPLLSAGAALACLWLPLTTSPATASAVTETTVGPPVLERTSILQRATRNTRPVPVWIRAVKAALAELGVRYQWGAKNPTAGGVDCSGLTQWAWRQAGVRIGEDTYAQVRQGTPVAPKDVRPADLIFPTAAFNSRGPGHVQLAIGDGKVIEAPGRGMTVRIVPLPTSFIARRIA